MAWRRAIVLLPCPCDPLVDIRAAAKTGQLLSCLLEKEHDNNKRKL
jgi:hypothetical protein